MKSLARRGSAVDDDARLLALSVVLLRRWLAALEAMGQVRTVAGMSAARGALEEIAAESRDLLRGY